jgi:hypothetical protein
MEPAMGHEQEQLTQKPRAMQTLIDCRCALWILLLSGWPSAFGQGLTSSVSMSENSTASDVTHNVAPGHIVDLLYPIRTKQQRPRILTFETLTPINGGGDHTAASQIPDFGGTLQSYANMTAATVVDSTKLPFGGAVTLALGHDRVEMFGGAGAVYVPFSTPYSAPNTWLSQTKVGVRVALDQERHFWVGATTYLLTNFGEKTKNRSYGSADFSVRFGK